MQIGIISDTHDRVARTGRAVQAFMAAGVEAIIHCGDLTGPEIVHECGLLPSYYVLGNNDFDENGLRLAIESVDGAYLGWGGEIKLAGKRIAVTHGHLPQETRRLVGSSPDFLLFGHSHVPTDRRDGPTRWINPGALHHAAEWTVATLDLKTDDLRYLRIE